MSTADSPFFFLHSLSFLLMLGGVVNFGCFFMYCQRKFTLMVLICSAIRFFASLYPNRFLTQTQAPSQQSISIPQTSFGTIFRDGKCCFGAIQHFCVTKQTAIVTTILQAESQP
jgi:hypothetical protein